MKGEKSYGAYKVDKCFMVFHLQSPLKSDKITWGSLADLAWNDPFS